MISTWGGFALNIVYTELTLSFPDHERFEVQKIHVYAERVVDNFETEYYNEVYREYIINPVPVVNQIAYMIPMGQGVSTL